MTYRELLYKAIRLINNNEITLGEYGEMTKPLDREVEQEPCEDAISREAVCNIVDDIRDCISVEGYWAILERLKKLPPVNPQEPMRDATLEERESVDKYIKSISKPTGVNFWDLKQEPKTDVLDKIRAEIMSLDYIDEDKYEGTSIDPQISRDDVFEIIDKYKAESEDKK